MATANAAPSDHSCVVPPSVSGPADRRAPAPGLLLRAEGALLFVVCVAAYAHLDGSWWLFAALLLLPDVGLVGYLAGPHTGALTYNLTHTLVAPIGLALIGLSTHASTLVALASIWAAHIGIDRAFGFGLKYATGFRDTHLQRVA